jgi:hypothetical protein
MQQSLKTEKALTLYQTTGKEAIEILILDLGL